MGDWCFASYRYIRSAAASPSRSSAGGRSSKSRCRRRAIASWIVSSRSASRSRCGGSSSSRRSVCSRIPTALIAWIESSWMSDAIRPRSSSAARTRGASSALRSASDRRRSAAACRSLMSRTKAVSSRPSSVSRGLGEMSTGTRCRRGACRRVRARSPSGACEARRGNHRDGRHGAPSASPAAAARSCARTDRHGGSRRGFGLCVDEHDSARGVHDHDGVEGGLERRGKGSSLFRRNSSRTSALADIADERRRERPSSVSIALSEMSTGNSLPSLRRPASASPTPIGHVRGSAR